MGISFKKLATAAALHAVTQLNDGPLDTSATATVEAKGLEAFETLKQEAAAEHKAFLSTPEGVRKALIAKRAGQARLATAACLASMSGTITTVQARRGMDMKEGKGDNRRELTPAVISQELKALLSQPNALKLPLASYDPAMKGAKPAPAPLLALRTLDAALKSHVRLNELSARAQEPKQLAKAG